MAENVQFALKIMDFAWFAAIAIRALSWAVLCHGPVWKWTRPGRAAVETLLTALFLMAGLVLLALAGGYRLYLLPQIFLHGAAGALMLHFCSGSQKKSKLVMWCSMLAGSCTIYSIAGQCSFLVGEFLASGSAEGVVRTVVLLLVLPLAAYLHAFSFQDYEQVPPSGQAAILIGDGSILAMNVLEVLWAGMDYRITIVFLVAYVFILGMVVAAIQGIYDMCAEQNKIVELQTERQRLHGERELARMMSDNLDDLRSIRHDLKNQYAYMQILLSQQRYGELEEYFRQSSQHLLPQLGQFIDCGNRSVNTILNMEFAKARKEGVSFTHQLVVPPVLPFSEDDLSRRSPTCWTTPSRSAPACSGPGGRTRPCGWRSTPRRATCSSCAGTPPGARSWPGRAGGCGPPRGTTGCTATAPASSPRWRRNTTAARNLACPAGCSWPSCCWT